MMVLLLTHNRNPHNAVGEGGVQYFTAKTNFYYQNAMLCVFL